MPATTENQKAYRSTEPTIATIDLGSMFAGHCAAAYQATRPFMAIKIAAIPKMLALLVLRLCFASDMTANWAAMASGSPKFATEDGPPPRGTRAVTAIDRNRAFGRAARRNRRSSRGFAWPRSSKETSNCLGKLLPYLTPASKRPVSALGHAIDPAPTSCVGRYPAAGEQPCLLQAMQRRVDGAFRKIERTAAPASDFLDDRIAVRWPRRQGGEDDHVEVALEHFAFHT